ncbi:hypothetical protein [Sphingorhabdus sp. Alg239-R122]|uniref:hypothetical protein n=1 Tax=Sphingorhabdus sp. Alg239-R122 TaxID=2305989 RepID=UPI0013DD2EBC|nr:hypothetical protein [Sphingorhabdus sp. Alg239-R122]
MEIVIFFWMLVILSCTYASFAGGRDGRRASLVILCASLLSLTGQETDSWLETQFIVMVIDLITLMAMLAIALSSKAYWPLWVAAFQVNTVATHMATLFSASFAASIYQALGGFWAIPGLLAMVIGIAMDQSSNLAQPGDSKECAE